MITFDWIMVAIIATTMAGSITFGLVAAKKEQSDEIASLHSEVERQRSKKKYWKSMAKGTSSSHEVQRRNPRRLALSTSGQTGS